MVGRGHTWEHKPSLYSYANCKLIEKNTLNTHYPSIEHNGN